MRAGPRRSSPCTFVSSSFFYFFFGWLLLFLVLFLVVLERLVGLSFPTSMVFVSEKKKARKKEGVLEDERSGP